MDVLLAVPVLDLAMSEHDASRDSGDAGAADGTATGGTSIVSGAGAGAGAGAATGAGAGSSAAPAPDNAWDTPPNIPAADTSALAPAVSAVPSATARRLDAGHKRSLSGESAREGFKQAGAGAVKVQGSLRLACFNVQWFDNLFAHTKAGQAASFRKDNRARGIHVRTAPCMAKLALHRQSLDMSGIGD